MSNMVSSISLCSVPITPTHQLDFKTIQDQQAYFVSKKVREYTPCKYTPRSGSIRIRAYVDELSDCNYGYYTNAYNGVSKTFYFWIVQKRLVAKNTTELLIQLDVFQTWQFDFELKQCFIERQHAINDDFGVNTYPENFELGEYISTTDEKITHLAGEVVYFIATTDNADEMGHIFGRTYTGFTLRAFDEGDLNLMSKYIQGLCSSGKADSIAFIFTYPKIFLIQSNFSYSSGNVVDNAEGFLETINYTRMNKEKFEYKGIRYAPFNKKLLTYPYNFITITNAEGGNIVLKYEDFSDRKNCKLKLQGVLTQTPTFSLVPCNYGGKEEDFSNSIECGGYGLCSWNNDNYANWYANNRNSISAQSTNAVVSQKTNNTIANNNFENGSENNNLNAVKGGVNTLASVLNSGSIQSAIGNAVTGGVNTGINYTIGENNLNNDLANSRLQNNTNYQNTIRSLMAQVQDARVQPNTCKGDTSSCGLDMARGTATFIISQTQIKPEYARKIDMYFQMFGYATNEIGYPNTKGRDKWNYIKTVNCVVAGNVPFEDREEIANLFNNGLTIWHGENFMFNYNNINNIIMENIKL